MLTFELVEEARAAFRRFVHRTPVLTSRSFDERAGREVFFKCENFQRAGAFKMRGATNKIQSLSEAERARGVVAFSSGNHAQAVALVLRQGLYPVRRAAHLEGARALEVLALEEDAAARRLVERA